MFRVSERGTFRMSLIISKLADTI